jgi:DNA-binding protein H-NS
LERKIVDVQREERSAAIAKVRALMAEYGLTAADVAGKVSGRRGKGKSGGKVAPKYRDAATGDTWSGRGLQPKWLKAALASGRKLSDFAL